LRTKREEEIGTKITVNVFCVAFMFMGHAINIYVLYILSYKKFLFTDTSWSQTVWIREVRVYLQILIELHLRVSRLLHLAIIIFFIM